MKQKLCGQNQTFYSTVEAPKLRLSSSLAAWISPATIGAKDLDEAAPMCEGPVMAIEPEEMLKTVLLVEDSLGDRRLAIEAFQETNKLVKLRLVFDGLDAMAYLRREGKYANAPRPELILLDLNLPKMGGREVLAQIKADESLKTIPTIILTTSAAPEDIQECQKLQADSYFRKPVGFEKYDELIRIISNCWLASASDVPRSMFG